MKKRPRRRKRPRAQKKPAISPSAKPSRGKSPSSPDFDPRAHWKLLPAWRVSRLEADGPFGWGQIERDKALEVRDKLGSFESMTWHQILVAAKHRNHTVSIEKLSKAARDRLVEIALDDQDELVSLRLAGAERVWGFREENVLQVLWWDPEHQVYPSTKKHT